MTLPPAPDDTAPTLPQRHRWAVLATLGLGVGTVVMDATIVNVALPRVIDELSLTAADAQWVGAAYSLVFAALLLVVGRVGDLLGRRRLFGAGIALFMLASVVAGLSVNAPMLITARFVQGVGAALVVPSTLSTLNASFTGRARTVAFAVWGIAIGGMAAVGPFVGGWLTTAVTWRWAFWLNIPIGLLVLTGIITVVPETRDRSSRPGLDLLGIVLSSIGMALVVFAAIEGSYFGWWTQPSGAASPVPFALVIGVALLAVFVVSQWTRRRRGAPVLVDLDLLRLPTFRYGIVAALVVAFGEFGLLFTLPLLLQGTLGYSAMSTGALMLVLAMGTFLVSGMLPRLTARIGQRAVVRAGLALEAISVGALALTLSRTIGSVELAGWLFGYGVGVGMATAQLTSVILSQVPSADSGQASGLQSSARQLGSALGVAVLGGLLITSVGSTTLANLTGIVPASAAGGIADAVRHSAGIAIAGLTGNPAVHAAAADAMVHASRLTTGAAALVILVGLLATLALPRTGEPQHAGADAVGGESAPADAPISDPTSESAAR